METWFINNSTYSPPVKWNCFTCGGGIFGFAKNDLDNIKYEDKIDEQPALGAAASSFNISCRVDAVCDGNSLDYPTNTITMRVLYNLDTSYNSPEGLKKYICTLSSFTPATIDWYTINLKKYSMADSSVYYDFSTPFDIFSTTTPSSSTCPEIRIWLYYTGNAATVTYKSNGGMPNTDYTQNVNYLSFYTTKPANTYTKIGYVITSWNTAANGQGLSYECEESYRYDVKGDATLYAQWGKKDYSIKFDANGGNVTTASKMVSYESNYGDLPTPTREGYHFEGWYRKYNRLDMEDFMNFFNEQEKLKDSTPEYMIHEYDGSYSWEGATKKGDDGQDYFYNVKYLNRGATYRISYTARHTRNDNLTTTGIDVFRGTQSLGGARAGSNQWKNYSHTFKVEDEFDMYFTLGWNYGERSYFKNIRVECVDHDDFETKVTSSTIMNLDSEHTLYAKWIVNTWDDYAAESYDSGSGTAVSPYIIKTPAQMAKLAKDSRNSNFAGMNYKLAADIDMRDYLWNAISDFSGVFDGGMHIISGVSSVEGNGNQGLFGVIAGPCTIKNLILTNSIFYTTANAGAFCAGVEGNVGCNYFRLQNCIAQNITIISMDDKARDSVGGLCGYIRCSDGLIENCMVDNLYVSTINISNMSALVGVLIDDAHIKNSCALNVDMRGSQNQPIRPTARLYDSNCDYEGTYVEFKKNGIMYKEIKGTQQQFNEAFFYNLNINKGYPLPRALVSFSDTLMGTGTYDFLVGKGFQYIKDGVIST